MANVIATIGKYLQPPVVPPSSEYHGLEYKYWKLAFRPAEYHTELYIVIFVAVYIAVYLLGSSYNSKRAHAWLSAHSDLYRAQFSRPFPSTGDIIKDGYTAFFSFATGRRHVHSLHSVFTFLPKQDLFQQIINFVWGLVILNYIQEDILELDFTLDPAAAGSPGWVWAVVKKDYMESSRKERWDLTFTKAADSTVLPKNMILMSESADVSESLLKALSTSTTSAKNLINILSDPSIQPYFRSLIITDQPTSRPSAPIPAAEKQRHLFLSLVVPPSTRAAVTIPLIQAIFDAIDVLGAKPPTLRPETKARLRQRREDLETELKKDAEREQKEIEDDNKRSERRTKKEEMIASMSSAEQKKQLEKEQKRNYRKAQGKLTKKG